MTVHIAAAVRTDRAQVILDAIDAGAGPGVMQVYGDTQATNADTAVGAQTLLLELTLQDPAGSVSGSVLTFDVTPTITDNALATDTATWIRILDSNNNVVLDGTVGTDVTISDATLDSGQTVTLVSATLTEPT
jgi:hypothetical protein